MVIVAIDQKSQDVLGRWPFPRSYFAQAVDFLREAHARVIAFDMNFPQADANSALEALRSVREDYDQLVAPPLHTPAFESELKSRQAAADNDQQFADALSRFDNAILGYFFISPEEAKSQNQERLKQFLDILSFQAYPQIIHPEYAKNFEARKPRAYLPICRSLRPMPKTSGSSISSRTPMASSAASPPCCTSRAASILPWTLPPCWPTPTTRSTRSRSTLTPSGVERIVLGNRTIPTDRQGFVQLDYDGPQAPSPPIPWRMLCGANCRRKTFAAAWC